MIDENKNDIHIGETERISWIEFDSVDNNFTDIDYIIKKYNNFWISLEIFCVAECCGLSAFRFYPDDIVTASVQK